MKSQSWNIKRTSQKIENWKGNDMYYNIDFSKINLWLYNNKEFRNKGGFFAADHPYGLDSVSKILYSVYLYLKYINKLDVENMKKYLLEMCRYKELGQTVEYHRINTLKLKLDNKYAKPLYYNDLANLNMEPHIDNTFIAIGKYIHF